MSNKRVLFNFLDDIVQLWIRNHTCLYITRKPGFFYRKTTNCLHVRLFVVGLFADEGRHTKRGAA